MTGPEFFPKHSQIVVGTLLDCLEFCLKKSSRRETYPSLAVKYYYHKLQKIYFASKVFRRSCYIHLMESIYTLIPLHEKCPYLEILRIFPYSFQMRENTDQKNSEYRHFLRSVQLTAMEDSIQANRQNVN